MEKQTIYGTVPSKSNSYKIVKIANKCTLSKSEALKKYEKAFYIQCLQYREKLIEGYFELYIDVYYPNERADLDNSLKVVLDCLAHIRAIKNDNKCVKIVAQKAKDAKNPRIEFEIKELDI